MSAIRYRCPFCERRLEHRPDLAGRLVVCSACMGEFYEPTDPLPGRPAERALKPLPNEQRIMRTPIDFGGPGMENQLAILSPSGAGGMASIQSIVNAVLLDDELPLPTPAMNGPSGGARPSHSAIPPAAVPSSAFGAVPPASVRMNPPSATANTAPMAVPAGNPAPFAKPAAPSMPTMKPSSPSPMVPHTPNTSTPGERFRGGPVGNPGVMKPAAPSPTKPAVPSPTKTPVPVPGLAGVSTKEMLAELRRRGYFSVLITCEPGDEANAVLAHSENMELDDAHQVLVKYLNRIAPAESKTPGVSGIFSRLFGHKDDPPPT